MSQDVTNPSDHRAEGFDRSKLGIAVIGNGRMGTHRAMLAAGHPAVEFLALSDKDLAKSTALGEKAGAHLVTADAREAIEHPSVNTVVVSTSEPEHVDAALIAFDAGKDVLIEKPIATTREDADTIIAAAEQAGVKLRIGYSQRFRRNTFLAKRHIEEGKLGRITGGTARVYNTRAQALAILARAPHISPVVDVLTYWVDVVGWFMGDNHPVEVYAAGSGEVLRASTGPDGPDDLTTAVIRYADGAVVSFTICYALPAEFPAQGQSIRVEIIGTEGVTLIDDDNQGNIVFSDQGVGHAYVPGHAQKMAYLGSTTSGDWTLGRMFGPIAEETRSWLDHLSTGSPTHLCTAVEARRALEITLAIEEAVSSGHPTKIRAV